MSQTIELPLFQPKKRPKFKREGEGVVVYYDQDYEPLRQAIKGQWDGAPLTGRVAVEMEYRVTPPKGASRARRAAMLAGGVKPNGAPLDGALRALLDAMRGTVVEDDWRVVFLSGNISYSESPGATVRVGEARFLPM